MQVAIPFLLHQVHRKQVLEDQIQIGKQLKDSNFTAVSGEGYFINQSSAITMNLPAGSLELLLQFLIMQEILQHTI